MIFFLQRSIINTRQEHAEKLALLAAKAGARGAAPAPPGKGGAAPSSSSAASAGLVFSLVKGVTLFQHLLPFRRCALFKLTAAKLLSKRVPLCSLSGMRTVMDFFRFDFPRPLNRSWTSRLFFRLKAFLRV